MKKGSRKECKSQRVEMSAGKCWLLGTAVAHELPTASTSALDLFKTVTINMPSQMGEGLLRPTPP